MKRLLMLLVPLIALTGCATYGDGYYRDRTVYRDGGYYYPAYDGDGDYYYGADDGYDYGYPYGGSIGYGYGYGYSPFWGLDRYRCRSYYGCVPSWGGYYPYHYSPGWSFSIGNTWGWNNWGWYGGYHGYDRPRYRDPNPRPDYPYYGNEDNYDRWPQPMPKPRPDRYRNSREPVSTPRPGTPVNPPRRPVVGGERARDPGQPLQRGYTKPAPRPEASVRPGTYPAPRTVGGERSLQPVRRATVPVQPAPARSGGTRMRYPEPVRSQPRQAVGQPAPAVRQVQGERYTRPAPQARPAPVPRATPMAKPAPRQAPPAPRPAPRPQVRPTSQNSTSDDEP